MFHIYVHVPGHASLVALQAAMRFTSSSKNKINPVYIPATDSSSGGASGSGVEKGDDSGKQHVSGGFMRLMKLETDGDIRAFLMCRHVLRSFGRRFQARIIMNCSVISPRMIAWSGSALLLLLLLLLLLILLLVVLLLIFAFLVSQALSILCILVAAVALACIYTTPGSNSECVSRDRMRLLNMHHPPPGSSGYVFSSCIRWVSLFSCTAATAFGSSRAAMCRSRCCCRRRRRCCCCCCSAVQDE